MASTRSSEISPITHLLGRNEKCAADENIFPHKLDEKRSVRSTALRSLVNHTWLENARKMCCFPSFVSTASYPIVYASLSTFGGKLFFVRCHDEAFKFRRNLNPSVKGFNPIGIVFNHNASSSRFNTFEQPQPLLPHLLGSNSTFSHFPNDIVDNHQLLIGTGNHS